MKTAFAVIAALVATVPTAEAQSDKLHFFDFDNASSIAETDNWKGAQQCVESWECRGARLCERGGWCSGFDGCEGSPLPTQAPGVSYTHLAQMTSLNVI